MADTHVISWNGSMLKMGAAHMGCVQWLIVIVDVRMGSNCSL